MPPPLNPRQRRQQFTVADLYPHRQDKTCRCGCGLALKGRRTSWATNACSDRALQDYSIRRGDTQVIRSAVFKRDRGICAACGMDTQAEVAICTAWEPPAGVDRQLWARHAAAVRLERQLQGFPSPVLHPWWHADHIVPVALGGGGCGLDGFATLCVPCHRRKTAQQATEAARQRQIERRVRHVAHS